MRDIFLRMRNKMAGFMVGRYGPDELARFELIVLWIPMLFSIFIRNPIINLLCWFLMLALVVHTYVRMFSKNISKRYAENQKFLNIRYQMVVRFSKRKNRIKQMKTHRFYKCPTCKQEVRVPKGHGKICITCPKCRDQFVTRS